MYANYVLIYNPQPIFKNRFFWLILEYCIRYAKAEDLGGGQEEEEEDGKDSSDSESDSGAEELARSGYP